MKQLLRELGRAINEAVSDSDRIADILSRIRANGYDVFLMLDAVVALNKQQTSQALVRPDDMTHEDHKFLKSLKIRLDASRANSSERDKKQGRFAFTPQDVKFLKSLRIDVEDLR